MASQHSKHIIGILCLVLRVFASMFTCSICVCCVWESEFELLLGFVYYCVRFLTFWYTNGTTLSHLS